MLISCYSPRRRSSARAIRPALPPTGKTDYYLFKKGDYPNDRYATDGKYPNMKGTELKLSGTRQDFDTVDG